MHVIILIMRNQKDWKCYRLEEFIAINVMGFFGAWPRKVPG